METGTLPLTVLPFAGLVKHSVTEYAPEEGVLVAQELVVIGVGVGDGANVDVAVGVDVAVDAGVDVAVDSVREEV